ncbi:MAG TPA: 2-C-methyl-D-erythritol 4-phosphate cytidylyltransferase [Thermodesulfobacteriota bacterium]|jgi:2-C-methyl-D-erythritol 4-phosphate cytidylyltransferase
MNPMKHTAIIVGGGLGKRFKGDIPKQFLPLDKRPIIVHTVEAFQRSSSIDAIVVVVPAGWEQRCAEDLKPYGLANVQGIIAGGATRQLSCYQALCFLKPDPPAIVVIHDAVRPLVSPELIATAVQEGREGMTFGLRPVETIVQGRDGKIIKVLPREELYQIQTPQAFPFQTLWDAHCQALEAGITDASDDAGLVLSAGKRVKVLPGDPRNIKITSPFDLTLAQHLLHGR